MPNPPFLILHVEDSPDDRNLLREMLSEETQHDLELVQAADLAEASQKIFENKPAAVLLDLNLSDSKGLDTLSSLSQNHPDLPVVVLTEPDMQERGQQIIRQGAQDFLPKDQISEAQVVRSLLCAIERKAVMDRLAKAERSLTMDFSRRTQELIEANSKLQKEINRCEETETKLFESRHTLSMVTDNIPARLAFIGKDLRYKFVNKAYEKFYNRPVEEIIGKHVKDVLGEAYVTQVMPHIDKVLSGESTRFEIETPSETDSATRWWDSLFLPSHDKDMEVNGLFVLANDITERKKWEEKKREQQSLLQKILEGIGAAVFFIDVERFEIVKVNKIAEKLLGRPADEIIGSRCIDFICVDKADRKDKECPVADKKILHVESKIERKDGSFVPVLKTVLPVMIDGRTHHVAILLDIAERKSIERQLAYAQKLESVGQLAAGIAHEINTPIQYIGSNLEFFKNVYDKLIPILSAHLDLHNCIEKDENSGACGLQATELTNKAELEALLEEVPQALEDALEGVQHVASIVMAMKKFSHPDVEERKLVNLNDAIQNTVTIARNEWKYVAEIKLELEELPLIRVFPGDINQALLNLLVNSSHAIAEKVGDSGDKGLITIKSRQVGDHVEISVNDDGCGIAEANRERVFDPFFTTKEVGKGTGQGLALTLATIEKHHGVVDLDSEEGKGSTFTIRLPMGQETEE